MSRLRKKFYIQILYLSANLLLAGCGDNTNTIKDSDSISGPSVNKNKNDVAGKKYKNQTVEIDDQIKTPSFAEIDPEISLNNARDVNDSESISGSTLSHSDNSYIKNYNWEYIAASDSIMVNNNVDYIGFICEDSAKSVIMIILTPKPDEDPFENTPVELIIDDVVVEFSMGVRDSSEPNVKNVYSFNWLGLDDSKIRKLLYDLKSARSFSIKFPWSTKSYEISLNDATDVISKFQEKCH